MTNMHGMFQGVVLGNNNRIKNEFNQDLSNWNVSNVTDIDLCLKTQNSMEMFLHGIFQVLQDFYVF